MKENHILEENYSNKGILKGHEPEKVLAYFEKICSIPHGSRNTKQMSDWIVSVAEKEKYRYTQDETGNIIVWVPASEGFENKPGYMLQGHMDMVAVKTKESRINLQTDPLELILNGNTISAKGTSLGGDDGIAVAYMLTIMTDHAIEHPALELVFTTDEEIGLQGIGAMDVSALQFKKLINLDSEDEGILIAGGAGGIKNVCTLPVAFEPVANGSIYELTIEGLLGGHSGMEIHKERGNANLLIARVLWGMREFCDIRLLDLSGGEKDNAIPNMARAVFASTDYEEVLSLMVEKFEREFRTELYKKDEEVRLVLKKIKEQSGEQDRCIKTETFEKILLCLLMNPNGVQAMSASLPGTVETSINCGIIRFVEEGFLIRYAIRSSVKSAKAYLQKRVQNYVEYLGGTVTTEGDYPPWEFKAVSPFRDRVTELYKRQYCREMEIRVIHAGLECGYLSERLEGLDCVSIGPDMKNIHTVDETLDIWSVKRVWEFLLEILQDREV